MAEKDYIFVKDGEGILAFMPGSSSHDTLVPVRPEIERCGCNIFNTKRCCSHIAAALGIIEKNGGNIPYADLAAYVRKCLEELKTSRQDISRYNAVEFMRKTEPFLGRLSREEKADFFLELCEYMESDRVQLTKDDFIECFRRIQSERSSDVQIVKFLLQNREKCMKAIVMILADPYWNPFSKADTKSILKEIAADDALAAKYLPVLAENYAEAFSRQQLLSCMDTLKKPTWDFCQKLFKKLVNEKPPMYEECVRFCQDENLLRKVDLNPEILEKLFLAGYGSELDMAVEKAVKELRGLEGYFRLIGFIPHDQFLRAWKHRKKHSRSYAFEDESEWEIEINFREDPEADPDQYYLDQLSCRLLDVIRQVRPEHLDEVNQAARKKYRKALKENNRKEMAQALMLLTRGGDAIAVKYAAAWNQSGAEKQEMLCLAAVGLVFDSLDTVAPELVKMEVPHAAGQD